MFWHYTEWTNAFLIQLVAILVAFLFGKKNKVESKDLFLAISLVSPVALFLVSAGVAGAIFLSDIAAIYLLFRRNNPIKINRINVFAFVLFILWPIISTMLSNAYSTIVLGDNNFDVKIFPIQTFRYFLYFILFAKISSNTFYEPSYLMKIFKVQSIMLLFIFTAILLGFFNIMKIDAWNELIKDKQLGLLGVGGSMFLYRGGVGTLSAISIPLIYLCFIQGSGIYKYLMAILIIIVFSTVLFSGSRQGITFTFLAFVFSIILFKQFKNAIQITIIGTFIIFLLMQNDAIRETSDWVFSRYDILLDTNIDLTNEIGSRNFSMYDANKQNTELIYKLSGKGLGGKIYPTESDYYNTYSYFGIIGLLRQYVCLVYFSRTS